MSDLERRHGHEEAPEPAHRRSSADRARLWASLNRRLGAEAPPKHRRGDPERGVGQEADRRPD